MFVLSSCRLQAHIIDKYLEERLSSVETSPYSQHRQTPISELKPLESGRTKQSPRRHPASPLLHRHPDYMLRLRLQPRRLALPESPKPNIPIPWPCEPRDFNTRMLVWQPRNDRGDGLVLRLETWIPKKEAHFWGDFEYGRLLQRLVAQSLGGC